MHHHHVSATSTSSHTIVHHHHVSGTIPHHTQSCTITITTLSPCRLHHTGAHKSVQQVPHHTQCHAPSSCQCSKYLITHNVMHHHHVSATSTSSHTMSCTIIMSVRQVPHHTQCHAPSSCQCDKYLITHTVMHHHHVSATSTSSHTLSCTITMSLEQYTSSHTVMSNTITMSVEQYLITRCHAPSPPSQSHHTDCTTQVHRSQTNMYLINHSFMITISTLSP